MKYRLCSTSFSFFSILMLFAMLLIGNISGAEQENADEAQRYGIELIHKSILPINASKIIDGVGDFPSDMELYYSHKQGLFVHRELGSVYVTNIKTGALYSTNHEVSRPSVRDDGELLVWYLENGKLGCEQLSLQEAKFVNVDIPDISPSYIYQYLGKLYAIVKKEIEGRREFELLELDGRAKRVLCTLPSYYKFPQLFVSGNYTFVTFWRTDANIIGLRDGPVNVVCVDNETAKVKWTSKSTSDQFRGRAKPDATRFQAFHPGDKYFFPISFDYQAGWPKEERRIVCKETGKLVQGFPYWTYKYGDLFGMTSGSSDEVVKRDDVPDKTYYLLDVTTNKVVKKYEHFQSRRSVQGYVDGEPLWMHTDSKTSKCSFYVGKLTDEKMIKVPGSLKREVLRYTIKGQMERGEVQIGLGGSEYKDIIIFRVVRL